MFDIFGCIFIIIILVFLIVGIIKGFASLILGVAKGLIALILAVCFCKILGLAVANSKIGTTLTTTIETKLIAQDATLSEEITNDNKQLFIETKLSEKIKIAKLPTKVNEYISNLITKKVNIPNNQAITCGNYIARGITMFLMVCISFVVIFLIALILLFIMQKLLKNLNIIPLVGPINRILGGSLGVVMALLIISGICYILSFMMYLPWNVSEGIKNIIKYDEPNQFTFGKFFIEHNFLKIFFNLIFK